MMRAATASVASKVEHGRVLKCIFFLTFARRDSIYESHCDFQIANFDTENHFDEERNQESRSQEKGCRKEKEVASRVRIGTQLSTQGSGNGALFLLPRLPFFVHMARKRAAVPDHFPQNPIHRPLPRQWIVVQFADELAAERPHVVRV
jgi:hypothetical protein